MKIETLYTATGTVFGRGGVVQLLKVNDDNVYRVFIDTKHHELIVQVCTYAYVCSDGNTHYDDSIDYNDCTFTDNDDINELLVSMIEKCETENILNTEYEYESE